MIEEGDRLPPAVLTTSSYQREKRAAAVRARNPPIFIVSAKGAPKVKRMRIEPDIAQVAALFGESSRAAILTALLDGRSLPAGELACVAGVGATAASGHLAKVVGGGLLAVETEGRHRYYRLAGPAVAAVIEDLRWNCSHPRWRSKSDQ